MVSGAKGNSPGQSRKGLTMNEEEKYDGPWQVTDNALYATVERA